MNEVIALLHRIDEVDRAGQQIHASAAALAVPEQEVPLTGVIPQRVPAICHQQGHQRLPLPPARMLKVLLEREDCM